ncbi:hypothetical protein AB0J82_22120 [Asanoa sp. NPDC049518]|uniref:hypothetical protein n=1 Tax=unclassified Asanoa TaxID=2685164 RepID=UPI00342BABE3
MDDPGAAVLLYWLPLGAGGRVVQWNGRMYEALVAWREHRPTRDLYHTALELRLDGSRFVVEMAPAWSSVAANRGVVQTGPVGHRALGRIAAFRYEVRRWRMGVIPDSADAVDGPRLVGRDRRRVRRLLDLVPEVPPLTWGRDEIGAGDMWNSNSLTAWLLAMSGHDMTAIAAPPHGRAPGWHAGLTLAATEIAVDTLPPA